MGEGVSLSPYPNHTIHCLLKETFSMVQRRGMGAFVFEQEAQDRRKKKFTRHSSSTHTDSIDEESIFRAELSQGDRASFISALDRIALLASRTTPFLPPPLIAALPSLLDRRSSLQMQRCYWISFLLSLSCFLGVLHASIGDADPSYRSCLTDCEKLGCVGDICFPQCNLSSNGVSIEGPLYLQWKQWDCKSDCRYHCMVNKEQERASYGYKPVKYHGKWPFKRVFGIQEPASVVFSALNLAMHFYGWLSFFILLHYKLPMKLDKKPHYDYAGLWHIYGLLALNSWFWSAVFHSRDVELTEKLDYFSAIALLGYSLIVSILRSFNVRLEAARVMVSAPLLAFVTTHILYLNNYKLDYGWNMKVCVTMGVAQLLIWAIWGGLTHHPSRLKLWTVVVGGALAMLLEIYDFPPYQGFIDAHAVWHATTVPLTYLWWSFIKDDAQLRTSVLLKKVK